jgi:hypothetical protein
MLFASHRAALVLPALHVSVSTAMADLKARKRPSGEKHTSFNLAGGSKSATSTAGLSSTVGSNAVEVVALKSARGATRKRQGKPGARRDSRDSHAIVGQDRDEGRARRHFQFRRR